MKLGNNNGQNKGKIYFLRRDMETIVPTEANRKAAEKFSQWFVETHDAIRNFLIMKMSFEEDVFSNTYLRIYEKILFTGAKIKDYRAYFHRSYYTNYIQDRMHERRYADPMIYDNRSDTDYDYEALERRQIILETDVFDYVYERYKVKEFELFKMYISLKPAINYNTLSEITGLKTHAIQHIISKILMDIRNNKELMHRYRTLAA